MLQLDPVFYLMPAIFHDSFTDCQRYCPVQQLTALYYSASLLIRENANSLFCPGPAQVIEHITLALVKLFCQNITVGTVHAGAKHRVIGGTPGFCRPAIVTLVAAYPAVVLDLECLPAFFRLFPYLIVSFVDAAQIVIGTASQMAGTLIDDI